MFCWLSGMTSLSIKLVCLVGVVLSEPRMSSPGDNGTMGYFVNKYLNPDHYFSFVRPGVNQGVPTTIYVDMYISSISAIDEINMEFSVTMFFRQRWLDPRLAFDEFEEHVALNYDLFSRLWVPDTQFDNLKSGHFQDITVPNRLIYLYPSGEIYYSQGLALILECQMNLYKFPMDEQECQIRFSSYALTERDLIVQWRNISEPVQTNKQLTLPDFDMIGVRYESCRQEFITGTFSCLVAKLDFRRKFNYYLIQVYLPSILVVTLSWMGFWIDADAVPARVSLGLLTVLTMTTQVSGANARQPRVSYVKALDVWMTTCLVFVFGSLIEYCVVNVFYRREHNKIEERKIRESMVVVMRRGIREDQYGDYSHHNAPKVVPPDLPEAKLCPTPRCPLWGRPGSHPGRKSAHVDDVSKYLFPGCFLLFNLVYWIMYIIVL